MDIKEIPEIIDMLERSAKKKEQKCDLSYDEHQEYLSDLEYQYIKLSNKKGIQSKID